MFKDQKYKKILREEGLVDYWPEGEAKNIQIPEGREVRVKNFRISTLQHKSIENVSLFLMRPISVELFATYFRLIDTTFHFTSIFIDEELREEWIQDNEALGSQVDAPKDDYKMKRQVRSIPTYGSPLEQAKAENSRAMDKEVLEDLWSLGYIK